MPSLTHGRRTQDQMRKAHRALGRRELFGPGYVETLLPIFTLGWCWIKATKSCRITDGSFLGRDLRRNDSWGKEKKKKKNLKLGRRRLTYKLGVGVASNASSSSRRERFDIYFEI